MKYYIGLAMAPASTVESGLAVIDDNKNIILIDKLFKVKDIQFFFDNYSSLKNSTICISLPWDNSMLEGKWRILSKPYQQVATNTHIPNRENWTQRYTKRGCEYFNELKSLGIDLIRTELYLARQTLNLSSYFKERTPADCKFLQNTLKIEHGFDEIPSNMMPAAQLEAIVCALIAQKYDTNKEDCKELFMFNGLKTVI